MKILLLNGPNMNMLGKRNPEIYGKFTLEQLQNQFVEHAQRYNVVVECKQSNSEGQLIDWLHQTDAQGVVLNPAAYTHYSYALRDAIECIDVPVVQVHLSNIMDREPFRQINVLSDVTIDNIYGKGVQGYFDALDILVKNIKGQDV